MVKFPDELYGCTYWDRAQGKRVLKKEATEEQKRIFEEFYRTLENEDLNDRVIEFNPYNLS